MFALILISLAIVVWIMGYRFYGKFLRLGILQFHDWSTPIVSNDMSSEQVPRRSLALSGFHAAASTGILSIIGAAIAMVWGWVPGFLWVVVAGMVAATVLSLGAMWISLRRQGESMAGLAFELGGLPAALSLFFMGMILLVMVGASLGIIIGLILHAHPEITWPFLSLLMIAGFWNMKLGNATLRWAVVIFMVIAAFVLGQYFPLSLGGSWTFSVRGQEMIGLKHELIWAGIALYMAYRAAHGSLDGGTQGRGILASLLALLVLILFTSGSVISDFEIDAPQFQNLAELPPTLVLLFLVITGGALSGMHALVASGCSSKQLQKQNDAMQVGYFGVGLDSLLAVAVIAALATGFSNQDDWAQVFSIWPSYGGLYVWLDLVITKMGLTISATGIPLSWSIGLVAALCVALALSMLETALRILSAAVEEFVEDFDLKLVNTPSFKQRAALTLIGITALVLSQTNLNLQHWLLIGITNQWFACVVLMLLGLGLMRLRRSPVFAWIPLIMVLPFVIWGTGWILWHWALNAHWVFLAVGGLTCALGLIFTIISMVAGNRLRKQRAEDTTVVPRF